MRLGFLDEAGRSRREPTIVVAGVIIHGDRHYRDLEDRIGAIRDKYIPAEDRDGFIFHATDLFHGSDYFKREKWPKDARYEILRELADLPRKVDAAVVFGHLNKAEYLPEIEKTLATFDEKNRPHVQDAAEHMQAFARCEIAIERKMHDFPRDEICMLIAEDTDRVKESLKAAHKLLKGPEPMADVRGLPLRKIVDTPHFALKQDSSPLQVADLCAFLILRRLNRRIESQPFYEQIAPQLTWRAVDFGGPMGNETEGGVIPG